MLVALAGFVSWSAARLEDQPPGQNIDPDHIGVVLTGAFAAYFCVVALWRLRDVSRGRDEWVGASTWIALAVAALLVVEFVAVASRLGG